MQEKILRNLAKYDKLIVTGPPRSGTTISAMILAEQLGYKFIDESWYDANNSAKFINLLKFPRNMVVQMTAFLKDIHTLKTFLRLNNISIVLIKRNKKEILDSFKNTKNFTMPISTSNGIWTSIGKEEKKTLLNHFDKKSGCIPDIIYNHFYKNNDKFFELNYPDDFKDHEYFVKKKDRRKHFKHIKQVKKNDPYYLQNQKGVMVV